MNKTELAHYIAESTGLSKEQAMKALNCTLDGICHSLEQGERVMLAGLGSFSIKERAARKGRNPKTGEEMNIPASNAVRFNPSSELTEKVSDN